MRGRNSRVLFSKLSWAIFKSILVDMGVLTSRQIVFSMKTATKSSTWSYDVTWTLLPLKDGILCSLSWIQSGLWPQQKWRCMASEARLYPASLMNTCSWWLMVTEQSPCCEEAQATTWRDHCSEWQVQLRAQPTARIMWVSKPSDVQSHPSLWIFPAEGPDITEQRQADPLCPFQIPDSDNLWV